MLLGDLDPGPGGWSLLVGVAGSVPVPRSSPVFASRKIAGERGKGLGDLKAELCREGRKVCSRKPRRLSQSQEDTTPEGGTGNPWKEGCLESDLSQSRVWALGFAVSLGPLLPQGPSVVGSQNGLRVLQEQGWAGAIEQDRPQRSQVWAEPWASPHPGCLLSGMGPRAPSALMFMILPPPSRLHHLPPSGPPFSARPARTSTGNTAQQGFGAPIHTRVTVSGCTAPGDRARVPQTPR